jgi:hypothetical protein
MQPKLSICVMVALEIIENAVWFYSGRGCWASLAGNVLLLQKKVHIHPDLAYIDFGQVIQLVGDYLVDSNPPHPVSCLLFSL